MSPAGWEDAPVPQGIPPGYEPPDGGVGHGPSGGVLPWEDGPGNEAVKFGRTIFLAMTEPVMLFTRVGESEGLLRPMTFAILMSLIGQVANVAHHALFGHVLDAPIRKLMVAAGLPATTAKPVGLAGDPLISDLITLALIPILMPIILLVTAAMLHVVLMMFSGANRSFAVTVRALCYASAPHVLGVIPVVGVLMAGVYTLVIEIIGLARAQQTSTGKAAVAVLSPVICSCVCVAVAFALMGAMLWKVFSSP